MKRLTNVEFNKKEARAISEALDIAAKIAIMEEDDRPSGMRYVSNPDVIRDLSYKIYGSQVTGAKITMVDKTDI